MASDSANKDTKQRGLVDEVVKNPYKALKTIEPYFDKITELIDKATPLVIKGWEHANKLWEKAQPYKPQVWTPALFGLLLVFFGGRFLTTIAAFEAVRLLGFKNLTCHIEALYENYKRGREAQKKDEDQNKDTDDAEPKAKRVALIWLKAVDPKEVSFALTGVYEIVLAVVATLRFKFAAAVTLGCSIGDMFHKGADAYLKPQLEAAIPGEYHKWIDPCIRYTCKSVGVSLAWSLQRIMSSLHSATRGAQIVVIQSQKALVELGVLKQVTFTEENPYFTLIVMLIAYLGFRNQVSSGFGFLFPFQILFLPLDIVEWLLTFFVGAV